MGRRFLGILACVIVLALLTVVLASLFGPMREAREQGPAAMAPTPTPTFLPRAAPTPPEPLPGPGTPGPRPTTLTRTFVVPTILAPTALPSQTITVTLRPGPFGTYSSGSQAVVSGGWGAKDGQFGRGYSMSGPSAFGVDGQGNIYVLDGVNRRVQRFDGKGAHIASFPVPVGHDMVVDNAGSFYLLDGYNDRVVRKYTRTGEIEKEFPVSRDIGLPTPAGLHIKGGNVFVESLGAPEAPGPYYYEVVKDGQPVPPKEQVLRVAPGKPAIGDESVIIWKRLSSTSVAFIYLHPRGELLRQVNLVFDTPATVNVGGASPMRVDDSGRMYLGVGLYQEGGPPRYEPLGSKGILLVLEREGSYLGRVEIPTANVTEISRPLVVTGSGEIYQMRTSETGVAILRWPIAR